MSDIKVKVGIDGEKQFRQAIKEINSELKLLGTEMKTVASDYDGQANSMAALTAKQKVYEQQIEATKSKIKTLTEALENAKNTFGENSSKVSSWQTKLNAAQAELNELNIASKDNQKYLEEAANAADGCATSIDKYGDSTRKAKESTEENANAVDTLASALAAAGLKKTLEEIADALRECVAASVEFESAMAGVAKTTDLSQDELAAMSGAIQEMSTRMPASTTEIAGVVEAAGQLGIAKEDLLSFAEVMVNLGVATNLTSDEAASALAKFANVVDMSADDYERLGSTIVDLGNNFATTEADIVSMGTRLASAGATIGLTEPQIMAIATALSSVGIEAEAGGSAISKLLKEFETMVATGDSSLGAFAEIAGMTASEFSQAWGQDAVGALSKFIDGLGEVDASGGSMVAVLSDLGITEVRLSNAVQALASSHGILNKAMNTANIAWEENNALTKEAETRYATTESKAQMLANAFNNVKIAVGDELTPALNRLYTAGTDASSWAAEFIQENEWLVPVLTGVVTVLGTVTAGVAAYIAWTKVATAVTTAFNAVMSAGPFLAVAAALGILVGLYVGFADKQTEVITGTNELSASIREQKAAIDELSGSMDEQTSKYEAESEAISKSLEDNKAMADQLFELAAATEKTAGQKARMQTLVESLSKSVPELAEAYDQETGNLDMTREALYALLEAEAQQRQFEADKEQWLEATAQQSKLLEQQAEAQETYNKALEEYQAALDRPTDDQSYGILKRYEDAEANLAAITAAVEENQAAVDAATEAMDSYVTATEEAAEAGEAVASSGELIESSMESLAEAYNTAYQAAADSLGSTVGLWTEMDNTASTSAADIKATFDSQTEWFTKYRENLDSLASRQIPGVDTSKLVESLSDGSAQAAEKLAGLAQASDEEIAEVVAAMGESDEARAALTDTMAQMSEEFQTKMDEIVQSATDMAEDIDQGDTAETSGKNTIQGYINGIDAKSSALYTKMSEVAKTAWDRFKAQLEEHSPSRVAMRSGRNTIEGYILGIEDKEDDLNEVMEQMAETVKAGLPESDDAYSSARDFIDAYKGAMSKYASEIKDTIDDLTKAQESMTSKLRDYGELKTSTSVQSLKDQVEAMRQYSDALAQLRERGADGSLMTEVVGMGIEDAIAYASQLGQLSDEAWDDYMSTWKEKQELAAKIAEDYYAGDLEEQTQALNSILDQAMSDLQGDGESSGASYIQGLIEGMESQRAALAAKSQELAAAMRDALNEALGIHSPSTVAMDIMGHFGDGLMLGWDDSIARLQATIESSIPQQVTGPVEKAFDAGTIITAMENTASGIVNGIAATRAGNSRPVQLRVDLDGRELAEGLVDPLRKTLRRRDEKL